MRSKKGSHRIVVNEVEYRWRATGTDFCIAVGIWPSNNIGPLVTGTFGYHATWIPHEDGSHSSVGDQIVITNKLICRIIEHAVSRHGYDPLIKGKVVNLKGLDDIIQWDDAVRATPNSKN